MKKILVADDNSINRKILTKILADDYQVLEARDGFEAFSKLEENPDTEAVLLDVVMPGMNGFDFLKIKADKPSLENLPVIVMTQTEGSEIEEKALALGASDFILKPYNPAIIRLRLANLLKLRENSDLINAIEKDSLTGSYNEETFYRKSQDLLANSGNEKYVVAAFNIERFKIVNDLYGTAEGDKLLKCMAAHIDEYAQKAGGISGRISADNFVMLIEYIEGIETQIEKAMVYFMANYPLEIKLSPRVGLYKVQSKTIPMEIMCDRANLAIESIKGKYKQHCAYYQDYMREGIIQEQEIMGDMHTALDNGDFAVYYQPKFDLVSERTVGAEALVRWLHPQKGIIPPDKFIPVFENNGFISALDMYVWRRVCSDMKQWKQEGYPEIQISVNVSRIDIYNPKLCDILCEICSEYDIPHRLLELEITETAYTQNPQQLVEMATLLKENGFTLAMDDFGSGYSSLNMFNEVPVDVIKLDMRFLKSTQKTPLSGNVLNFVINMAKWMNIPVVAEGVETPQQVSFLRSMGCNVGQGYYYSKPVTSKDFVSFLKNSFELSENRDENTVNGLDVMEFWNPNSQFNLLFNLFVGALVILQRSGDKISILRANDAWYDIFGADRTKIYAVSADIKQLLYKDDKAYFDNIINNFSMENGEIDIECRWTNPVDGKMKILKSHVREIFNKSGRSMAIASTEDITQRKNSQLQLSHTLRRLESITSSIPGGLFRYNTDKNEFDYISANTYKLLGYTPEEFKAKFKNKLENLICGENRSQVMAEMRKKLHSKNYSKDVYQVEKADGSLMWIMAESNLAAEHDGTKMLYCVMLDITHQKKIEEELVVSTQQMDLVFQQSNIDMWRYDAKNEMVTHISGSFRKRGIKDTSMPVGEFVKIAYAVHPDFYAQAEKMNQELIEGKKFVEAILKTRNENGEWRWSQIRYNTIFDKNGRPISAIGSRIDINEKMEAKLAFEKEIKYIYSNAKGKLGFFAADISGKKYLECVFENNTFELRQAAAQPNNLISHPDDCAVLKRVNSVEEIKKRVKNGNMRTALEYRVKNPKNLSEYIWVQSIFRTLQNPDDGHIILTCVTEDIDMEKKTQLKTQQRAERDALTGLYNRASLEELINQNINVHSQNMGAFLLFDVDNFKDVNDNFGHVYGDEILCFIAETISGTFRSNDIIGRLGGDEMVVYMSNISDISFAMKKAKRICRTISDKQLPGKTIKLSCSVGISRFPNDGKTYEELYRTADIALYQAKKQGKNRATAYKAGL